MVGKQGKASFPQLGRCVRHERKGFCAARYLLRTTWQYPTWSRLRLQLYCQPSRVRSGIGIGIEIGIRYQVGHMGVLGVYKARDGSCALLFFSLPRLRFPLSLPLPLPLLLPCTLWGKCGNGIVYAARSVLPFVFLGRQKGAR